jgi:hypothetical protein
MLNDGLKSQVLAKETEEMTSVGEKSISTPVRFSDSADGS